MGGVWAAEGLPMGFCGGFLCGMQPCCLCYARNHFIEKNKIDETAVVNCLSSFLCTFCAGYQLLIEEGNDASEAFTKEMAADEGTSLKN